MEKQINLRKGLEWSLFGDGETVDRFHLLVKQHGSKAVWLPVMGVLVTRDKTESNKNFPYEQWLRMAMYDGPAPMNVIKVNSSVSNPVIDNPAR